MFNTLNFGLNGKGIYSISFEFKERSRKKRFFMNILRWSDEKRPKKLKKISICGVR
jgi:hypothetical protein